MIFEVKNYQTCKQYKIDGAVVKKSIFEAAQKLEKENAEFKEILGYLISMLEASSHNDYEERVKAIIKKLEGGQDE